MKKILPVLPPTRKMLFASTRKNPLLPSWKKCFLRQWFPKTS